MKQVCLGYEILTLTKDSSGQTISMDPKKSFVKN
jgi:hypothetical protein